MPKVEGSMRRSRIFKTSTIKTNHTTGRKTKKLFSVPFKSIITQSHHEQQHHGCSLARWPPETPCVPATGAEAPLLRSEARTMLRPARRLWVDGKTGRLLVWFKHTSEKRVEHALRLCYDKLMMMMTCCTHEVSYTKSIVLCDNERELPCSNPTGRD